MLAEALSGLLGCGSTSPAPCGWRCRCAGGPVRRVAPETERSHAKASPSARFLIKQLAERFLECGYFGESSSDHSLSVKHEMTGLSWRAPHQKQLASGPST